MKLATEFVRLPYTFDIQRLQEEISIFTPQDWLPHVQGFEGNSAIPLISLKGEMNNDFNGPMEISHQLKRLPYTQQVLASFGEVFGRSRLMGLAPGCRVPEHRDVNYHWYKRVRIHIPLITNPKVLFYCGDTHVHMAEGETWIFDSWKKHWVENNSDAFRVHLVIDTIGSFQFWDTVAKSEWRCANHQKQTASIPDKFISFKEGETPSIPTERFNAPLVMHPGEVEALILDIISDARACRDNPPFALEKFENALTHFRHEWHRLWSLWGQTKEGWPYYERLIKGVRLPRETILLNSNLGSASHTFGARVLTAVLNLHLAEQYHEKD